MQKYRFIAVLALAVILAGCATTAPYFTLSPAVEKDIVTIRGSQYVPLIRLCDEYKLKYDWDGIARTITLEGKGNRIVMRSSSDRMLFNGREDRLDRPAVMEKGAIYVPVSFARANMEYLAELRGAPAAMATPPSGKFAVRTIALDAGHGGRDAGAVGRRYRLREKDYALKTARKLKDMLEDRGVKVVMTRSNDTFISLPERVRISNRSDADLFVSVHINASRARGMNGFECYYLSDATDDNARAMEALENSSLDVDGGAVYDNNSKNLSATLRDMTLTENRAESAELARYIANAVEDTRLVRNNGAKAARFYVLKHSSIPAVLVELCYISHGTEEEKLKDADFLGRMTAAVAKGILRYKDEYERTEGFTNI